MDRTPREHPYIPELKFLLQKGRISRREFMRNAALLGMSIGAINAFLTSCAPQATPTAAPAVPTAGAAPTVGSPAAGVVRGGVLRATGRFARIDHPARLSWVTVSNLTRQMLEYLTFTDKDNVTHPYLLEKWEASDDAKTWTLFLRKGIKFSHGKELNADDVIFNFQQWLNDDVASSMKGLIEPYLSANNVEKVDEYTVRLHCSRPEIAVPDHLFHYPAMILPSDFEGDWLKQPHGTGPFALKEWIPEERAVAERRTDYWRNGEDGSPLPYLDRIEWYHLGDERAAHIAAMQSGQAEVMEMPQVEDFLALRDNPDLSITPVVTAQTNVLRMRADVEPWSDPRVRKALMLCQDREKILQTAAFGEGVVGQDHHVAPVHPEYCPIDTPAYDPQRARELLAEAGYPDGIDAQLTVGTAWADQMSNAETLKADAEAGGFRLTINTMPGTEYWNVWTEVDLGITIWTHRSLGTMVLSLAYTVDEKGQPTSWNETKWVDEEFITLLNEANSTVDIEARREIMCKLEQIQQDRGTIGVPYWRNCWRICAKNVRGLEPHPSNYDDFSAVWLEKKS